MKKKTYISTLIAVTITAVILSCLNAHAWPTDWRVEQGGDEGRCYISYSPGADSDRDGMFNSQEDRNANCIKDRNETDIGNSDTDGDGIGDFEEMCQQNASTRCTLKSEAELDPDGDGKVNGNDTDSDDDGWSDSYEDVNLNGRYDTRSRSGQRLETNPYNEDTDGDGFIDPGDNCPNQSDTTNTCSRDVCIIGADPGNANSDNDLLLDREEDLNRNCAYDIDLLETNLNSDDTDGDGLLDHEDTLCPRHPNLPDPTTGEIENRIDLAPPDCITEIYQKIRTEPNGDRDGDGIPNGAEDPQLDLTVGRGETNPLKEDTDDDGFPDLYDCCNNDLRDAPSASESPVGAPNDYDAPDDAELMCARSQFNANFPIPDRKDCDRDGIPSKLEDKDGNGVVQMSRSNSETDPFDQDSDDDGLLDGMEDANANGIVDPGETDPRTNDTDHDLIFDGLEDFNRDGVYSDSSESNPTSSESDSDGILDKYEDANHNGVCDISEKVKTDTVNNGDGEVPATEWTGETCAYLVDTDYDGAKDGEEDCNKNGKREFNESDPLDPDTDDDGLLDGVEDANHNCLLDKDETSPIYAATYGRNDKDYWESLRGQGCGLTTGNAAYQLFVMLGMLPLVFFYVRRKVK